MREFYLFNTLSGKREKFEPLHPGMAGIYVCGPTVYGDAHLGHARPAITYDVLVRFLRYLGYKVRYVRNITDVGHLESDADEGEDKIAKKARLEELEPMEVVQSYTLRYHEAMKLLNTLPPSIEPRASGHIIEQISLTKKILESGFAYESNGSVYFDVIAYNKKHPYGILSGRNLEELISNSRTLEGTEDKRSPFDFALWKKASEEHIMKWPSPWSVGFPGWHLECSAMSAKYLGDEFDIHGGGMDLLFPHHECELAQNTAARGNGGVHYWMHNNMITINGRKMGKSLGNFITLEELFTGSHQLLDQPYSPMTIRFFILQAHYRSTLDFSNEAMQAAEKGVKKLLRAAADAATLETDPNISTPEKDPDFAGNDEFDNLKNSVLEALCDDLNTPVALANIFEAVRIVNQVKEKSRKINDYQKKLLLELLVEITGGVLGLESESSGSSAEKVISGLMDVILEIRAKAKEKKEFETSDTIRRALTGLGITIRDTKEGPEWSR